MSAESSLESSTDSSHKRWKAEAEVPRVYLLALIESAHPTFTSGLPEECRRRASRRGLHGPDSPAERLAE